MLIPSATLSNPLPAFLAEFPIESMIPATESKTLENPPLIESITFEIPSVTFLNPSPNESITPVMMSPAVLKIFTSVLPTTDTIWLTESETVDTKFPNTGKIATIAPVITPIT